MQPFSIEKAKQGGTIQTRCGFQVAKITYDIGIDDTPIAAVVLEVVEDYDGRRRKLRLKKKKTKKHIEPNLVVYHADGRLYDDRDDPFDLVIMEEPSHA